MVIIPEQSVGISQPPIVRYGGQSSLHKATSWYTIFPSISQLGWKLQNITFDMVKTIAQ